MLLPEHPGCWNDRDESAQLLAHLPLLPYSVYTQDTSSLRAKQWVAHFCRLVWEFCLFEEVFLGSPGWLPAHYIDQAVLELTEILLLLPPDCQDYRQIPS